MRTDAEVLIDTNVVIDRVQIARPRHGLVRRALAQLVRDYRLCIVPQVVYELWVVTTRPVDRNGLGQTATEAAVMVRHARELLPLLDDPTGLYEEWERLVTDYAVLGKQAHDARIAAAMRLLGVRRILTFNTADFARYDFIEAISPADI